MPTQPILVLPSRKARNRFANYIVASPFRVRRQTRPPGFEQPIRNIGRSTTGGGGAQLESRPCGICAPRLSRQSSSTTEDALKCTSAVFVTRDSKAAASHGSRVTRENW